MEGVRSRGGRALAGGGSSRGGRGRSSAPQSGPFPGRGVTLRVLPSGSSLPTTSGGAVLLQPGQSPVAEHNEITYRVRIINPARKRDPIIRDLRHFHGHFHSIVDMRVRLMEEFQEQLPQMTTFDIGYFAGRQSNKHWIFTEDDLMAMYTTCPNPDIMLWCEGRGDDDGSKSKKKRTEDIFTSKRDEKERKTEDLTEELMELHKESLDLTEIQYRLWARMIVRGCYSSKDVPPDIPTIRAGVTPKRKQKRTDEERRNFQESVVNTAAAVAKAVSGSTLIQSPTVHQVLHDSPPSSAGGSRLPQGISPGKASDIRGKSFGHLSTLKQLYDDHILTEEEFLEQKNVILSDLKKL